MTFFAFLIGGSIGFGLGYYTGTHPGWTAPIVAWIKSKPWGKKSQPWDKKGP